MFRDDKPIYLPPGSVRAIIALTIVTAAVVAGIVDKEILLLVLGFYFGSRAADRGDERD